MMRLKNSSQKVLQRRDGNAGHNEENAHRAATEGY